MTDTTAKRVQGKGYSQPFDQHVGEKMRLQRRLAGMNQTELARHLGVTFQQVQKYENGKNRVSASMLYAASQALSVPFGFWAEGFDQQADIAPLSDDQRDNIRLAVAARHATPQERDAVVGLLRTLTHGRTLEQAHG